MRDAHEHEPDPPLARFVLQVQVGTDQQRRLKIDLR
jgi:hypothetical protein